MNGKEYPIHILFKNPNMARDVYKRYQTRCRAMGISLDGQVRLESPRLYLNQESGRFLNDFVAEAANRNSNSRYKIEKGEEYVRFT